MSHNNKIYIGTSGWVYDDWARAFYPARLNQRDWLKYYSNHFITVEINASFYHLLSAKTYERWLKITPKNFVFSVKISRYLTHIKKLNDSQEPWQRFINNAKCLDKKLGPILVQLPPNFKANSEKLSKLLKIIPKKYKIALEARNKTWFTGEIYDILKKHNAAMVLADSEEWSSLIRMSAPGEITVDFIYIRMHGPGNLYNSKYTLAQLKNLAKNIKLWKRKVKEIYVYFNNDTNAYAVQNATRIKQLLGVG